jgi:hypothetical protein
MSSKRRTRKQKVTASARHNFSQILTVGNQQVRIAVPSQNAEDQTPNRSTHFQTVSHAYVATDVRKTLTITTVLIALDIILYFILKLSIVNFPGINF